MRNKREENQEVVKMKKKMLSVVLAASMLAAAAVPAFAEEAETPENTVTGDASSDDAFVV